MGRMDFVHLFFFGLCICFVQSCTLEGYVKMGIMERFVQSEYVVYGRTMNHQANKVVQKDESMYIIDAIFQVNCVMKRGQSNIGEVIIVSGIAPRHDWSGTPVHTLMRVGDHVIIALKNSTGGKFLLDEIMPKTSAAVRAYKPYFFSFSKICDTQTWEPPAGASANKCPICGINDFEVEIGTLNNTEDQLTTCSSTQNAVATDMTACDLYTEYSIDEANSQTCVPANFTESCTSLMYRTANAKCDCNPKKKNILVGVGAGQTIIPSAFLVLFAFTALLNNTM